MVWFPTISKKKKKMKKKFSFFHQFSISKWNITIKLTRNTLDSRKCNMKLSMFRTNLCAFVASEPSLSNNLIVPFFTSRHSRISINGQILTVILSKNPLKLSLINPYNPIKDVSQILLFFHCIVSNLRPMCSPRQRWRGDGGVVVCGKEQRWGCCSTVRYRLGLWSRRCYLWAYSDRWAVLRRFRYPANGVVCLQWLLP